MILFLMTVFPMALSFAAYFTGRKSTKIRNLIAVITTAAELLLAVSLFFVPDFRFELAGICGGGILLELDGFRRVYVCIACFMWLITTLVGNEYFSHYADCHRYYFFNLLTLGATVGVFLAGNLFTALIYFEIMSFTSFTFVIQEETEGAVRAANTYLAVAVIGGMTALMGLFLLENRLGTTEISRLYELAKACPDKKTLYIAGACILFGFGAKAGMFPLHIWLPKAHPVAPAPASALLSGILTKSGIFGILAISCNLFRHDPAWGKWILIIGTVTMFLGALLALFSVDLKRTLACSSVSQIGFILVGVGVMTILGEEGALAANGTILHMMNHSLFKLVLFLCAAIVYMNLHKLNLNDIRGFGRKKPLLWFFFLMGALGIGGIPGWSGYVSKTLLHEGIVEYIGVLEHAGQNAFGVHAVEWIFLTSGGITVAYMTKLFVALFIEKNEDEALQLQYDQKKKYMKPVTAIAMLLTAAVIPATGMHPNGIMDKIAFFGTDFFRTGELEHSVHYFSFENLKGSLISIGIGFALYFGFVRTCLMKKGSGRKKYVNLWPAWLDLEELLYRPLLLKWLPGLLGWVAELFGRNRLSEKAAVGVFSGSGWLAEQAGQNRLTGAAANGVFRTGEWFAEQTGQNAVTGRIAKGTERTGEVLSHAFSDSTDAAVYGLKKTVYRETVPKPSDDVTRSAAFRAGERVDEIRIRHGKEEAGGKEYAELFYRARETRKDTRKEIKGTVSFALIMMCIAIILIFIYLILLHV